MTGPPISASPYLPNGEVEKVIRFRTIFSWTAGITVWFYLGGLGYVAITGRQVPHPELAIPLTLTFGIGLGIGFGYLISRMAILLAAPLSVAIDSDRILADFRRRGWPDAPLREILFQDLKVMRRSRVLRIPLVKGTPHYDKVKPVRDTPLMYLTRSNLGRLRARYQEWQDSGRSRAAA